MAPTNSWPMATPPAGLRGAGFAPGEVAPDVRGIDQHGDEVSLWQFYGTYVLIDISTMWCRPCQQIAMGTEDVYQHFRSRNFLYLTVLHEDVDNEDVSVEEANEWASLPSLGPGPYDVITAPVIADQKGASGSIDAVQNNQYPVALLVGPDMKVLDRIEPVSEAAIEAALDETLPE